MSDLDPAELSALLDGELDPVRAREIEALIAADPALAAEFEQLKRMDGRLRSAASAAAFRPDIEWPAAEEPALPRWLVASLAAAAVAWAIGKVAPAMILAFGVNAAALALFIAILAPLAARELRAGRPQLA
jgi:anti-sigma factor RsiW